MPEHRNLYYHSLALDLPIMTFKSAWIPGTSSQLQSASWLIGVIRVREFEWSLQLLYSPNILFQYNYNTLYCLLLIIGTPISREILAGGILVIPIHTLLTGSLRQTNKCMPSLRCICWPPPTNSSLVQFRSDTVH